MPNRVKDKANKEKQAYDFFIQKGLTPIQSAALVGNFIVESGLNTRIEGDRELSTPSVGIAQWRESRLADLRKKYDDPYSFENQLDFVWWELNNTESSAFKYIKENSETLKDAAIAVRQKYERAWAAHDDRRVNFAQNVFNSYSSEEGQGLKYANANISEAGQAQQTIDNTAASKNLQNLINLQNTKQNTTFVLPFTTKEEKEQEEKDTDSKEVSQAKEVLNKRKATRDFLTQLVQQNLSYEPVEYIRTNPYQGQPSQVMEDGGKVRITDVDGNEQLMDINSKEYRDLYNEGGIGVKTGENEYSMSLPGIEFSSKDRDFGIDFSNKETFSEEELAEILKQRISTPDVREQPPQQVKSTIPGVSPQRVQLGEVLPQEDIDEVYTDFLTRLPETTIVYNRTQENLKKQINSKEEGLSPVRVEPIDLQSVGSREDIKGIQKKLSEKGYNLNPHGTFKNEGIDGIAGKVTLNAIDEYNKSLRRGEYQSVKDGAGFLGKCTEQQCSEYVQNETFRNLKPDISREEWNRLTGLHGDAWDIGANIEKAGGKKIEKNQIKSGDIVTMYTGGGSTYQAQADRAGTGTTHTGIVDQVNPDGSYYILQNIHEPKSATEYAKRKANPNHKIEWQGMEYRTLVKNGITVGEERKGRGYQVRGIFRANTEGLVERKDKPLREDVSLRINPDKQKVLEGNKSRRNIIGNLDVVIRGKENTMGENIEQFVKPLNNFENKQKFSQVFSLDEEEYQSLSKIVIGIIGQETSFGTSPTPLIKEPLAILSSKIGSSDIGSAIKTNPLTPSFVKDKIKGDEASRGAGRLKFDSNFHSDLTEFGVNKSNFTEAENMPITIMYKIAGDYKNFLNQGYEKKDAMYRAIVTYNASLSGKSQGRTREEWASEYNVDYANKVLNYANVVDVRGEDKNYKTTVDELLLKDNVLKWSSTLKGRGEL